MTHPHIWPRAAHKIAPNGARFSRYVVLWARQHGTPVRFALPQSSKEGSRPLPTNNRMTSGYRQSTHFRRVCRGRIYASRAVSRLVRLAAKSRAGHAPPLPRSKKPTPSPRPYIALIQIVRAWRAHLNFYLLSFISYLKTTPPCAYCAGRRNHFTPSARRNQGCRSYPAPAPAGAKTSAYTRDNR